jgi:hypothetical protein
MTNKLFMRVPLVDKLYAITINLHYRSVKLNDLDEHSDTNIVLGNSKLR